MSKVYIKGINQLNIIKFVSYDDDVYLFYEIHLFHLKIKVFFHLKSFDNQNIFDIIGKV